MRYVGKCKRCGFVVSADEVVAFKDQMATHLSKSHGLDYGFEVADIRLDDFGELFTITRIRDSWVAEQLKIAFLSKGFWKYYRKGI